MYKFLDLKKFRPHNTMHLDLYEFDYQNGIYYFNVGEGQRRSWADCRNYGYLSAGGGRLWSDQIQTLIPGDVVAAYLSDNGYVVVGIVCEPVVMARGFEVAGKRLNELELERKGILDDADDPDMAEYVARIDWKVSSTSSEAIWAKKKGLFSFPMAKASLQNQPKTVDFISDAFNIDLRGLLKA